MANPIPQGDGDSNAIQTLTPQFIPGFCFSRENPIEYALSINLILQEIFRQCVDGKDIKLLLSVRRVCKWWGLIATGVLHDCARLLPKISTRPNLPRWWWWQTSFTGFVEASRGTSNWELPLNLIITKWSPEVTQFLTERAEKIVSVELNIEHFEGFKLEQSSFNLPSLRRAVLSFDDQNQTYHIQGFQDVLVRFKHLIKGAEFLTDCEVRLSLPDAPTAVNEDSSLIQLPHQLTLLKSHYKCFEEMSSSQTWPKLKTLNLKVPLGHEAYPSPIRHLPDKVSHLTCLKLYAVETLRFPEVQLPLMQNLTRLVMWNVGLRGQMPLHALLPQLRDVDVFSGGSLDVLSSLIRGELPNVNVTKFRLDETSVWPNPDIVQRMAALTKRFPNLVRLKWSAREEDILSATSIIFANLERLKELSIFTEFDEMELDTMTLITGVSREEIPEDEATWPEALVGRKNAITNLKCLEALSLTLRLDEGRREVIPQRESKFLFQAAFNLMKNLKLIHIISVLDEEVRAEWVARGNVFINNDFFELPAFKYSPRDE